MYVCMYVCIYNVYFSEDFPTSFPFFKCIKPILPRRSTMVFARSDQSPADEQLTYVALEFDPPTDYDPGETGFSGPHLGDSGSPYWMEVQRNDDSEKRVNAIIAVHSQGTLPGVTIGSYANDKKIQCRSAASKVREETVNWIMAMHGSD